MESMSKNIDERKRIGCRAALENSEHLIRGLSLVCREPKEIGQKHR